VILRRCHHANCDGTLLIDPPMIGSAMTTSPLNSGQLLFLNVGFCNFR
jgi:hypothetical protein